MTRKEFVKISSLLGIGLPFYSSLTACENQIIEPGSDEKVIIIGAGAAGLSAAYLLAQKGIEYEILEASTQYGGRMKRNIDFADFPIPLGAEWLHVERG
ncbi:MAG: FAD-dependent oxidoreductase, partial [Bacteroidota bacterium]